MDMENIDQYSFYYYPQSLSFPTARLRAVVYGTDIICIGGYFSGSYIGQGGWVYKDTVDVIETISNRTYATDQIIYKNNTY